MNRKCIFCKISNAELPHHKIWENDNFLAVLDVNPINPGHTLVIPKKHIDYIFDLQDKTYSEIFKVVKKIAGPLRKAMKSKRIGIAIEGFGVAHVHIHLVPINTENELDPHRAIKARERDLVKIAKKIRRMF